MALPVVGPRRHGVVEFGIELAKTMQCNGFDVTTGHAVRPEELRWPSPGTGPMRGVHLQFTDRIFGSTPRASAEVVRAFVEAAEARGLRVTATLHDVPQPSDGDHYGRRTDAYAVVCAALHGVVVNSDHERLLLSESGIRPREVEAIPLPVRTTPVARPAESAPPSVGIFGFLYPGKGHREVMTALGDVDQTVGLVAVGEPSAGHEHLLDDLRDLGRGQGRSFDVTGHVPEAQLAEVLRRVTVPVVHHRHVSASGSMNSWIAAGRRPLVAANRYTVEMRDRNPESFLLYDDDETALRSAIRRALADPGLTWLPMGTVATPTAADAAGRYDQILRRWHP